MGKARKKKGATDFNELLVDASKTEREATGWQSGVSAMALDEDPHSAAGPAAAAATEGMDTTEAQPKLRPMDLGVQKQSMKASRGNRTLKQKKRKAGKQEKALARAEKVGVRVAKGTQRKQLKATLKALY